MVEMKMTQKWTELKRKIWKDKGWRTVPQSNIDKPSEDRHKKKDFFIRSINVTQETKRKSTLTRKQSSKLD